MNNQLRTTYDEVRYPSLAHVQTHPDRLATIATLFGMQPAPVARCRVLELGSGDGTNLIAMAYGLPESEFTGIDLAGEAVAEARRTIEALALKNAQFHHLDLMDYSPGAEMFDYIIAHGFYSWAPAPVRDRILEICGRCLAPKGVAYVSYNTYPGCHIREMVSGMMLYHARGARDAAEKIAQSRALLKFLAGSKEEPDLYRMILRDELQAVEERSDGGFYHDDLNPYSEPLYFHQFVEHAGRHGLQYLGDAMFNEMQPGNYTEAALAALRELDEDIVAREQYLDFLMCRRFRRTLLCRSDAALDYTVRPGVIIGMLAASNADPVSPAPDAESPITEEFKNAKGASIQTNQPLAKAALLHLSRSWPRAIPFGELLAAARADGKRDAGEEELRDLLLRGFAAGAIELHTWAPRLEAEVSERPVASELARYQNRLRTRVTTLHQTGIELTDPLSRDLLELLDGTRDCGALVEALAALAQSRNTVVNRDGAPATDPEQVRAVIAEGLPAALRGFARAGILVG